MKRYRQDSPALKLAEERYGDLDGDGEVGEDPQHVQKVRKATQAMAKKALPPAFAANAQKAAAAPTPKGKGKKTVPMNPPAPAKGKMCPACMKSGAKSCSH